MTPERFSKLWSEAFLHEEEHDFRFNVLIDQIDVDQDRQWSIDDPNSETRGWIDDEHARYYDWGACCYALSD